VKWKHFTNQKLRKTGNLDRDFDPVKIEQGLRANRAPRLIGAHRPALDHPRAGQSFFEIVDPECLGKYRAQSTLR
jgi:hypothetical protein